MKKIFLISVICLSLSACFQTSRETYLIGHQSSSGEVILAYEVKPFEEDDINWDSAREKVKKHCQHVLGYSDAERFGDVDRVCVESSSDEYCFKYKVEVPYKCLTVGLDTEK